MMLSRYLDEIYNHVPRQANHIRNLVLRPTRKTHRIPLPRLDFRSGPFRVHMNAAPLKL